MTSRTPASAGTAPTVPGCYYLIHRPIADEWTWFGEHNLIPVAVGNVPRSQRGTDRITNRGPCKPPDSIPTAPYK